VISATHYGLLNSKRWNVGVEVDPSTPEQFMAFIKSETARLKEFIRAIGIPPK
jgi:hypothetical protein